MHRWTLGSVCIGLVALAFGCSSSGGGNSEGAPGGGGGSAPSTGTDAGAGGTGAGVTCSLVTQGVPVSRGRGTTPSIAWTGEGYAIAWQDLAADDGDIHLATVDATGNKLREEVIAEGRDVSSHPSLVRDGDELVVLWQDKTPTGSAVRGRRASLAGAPTGSAFTVAQSSAADAWPIAAATADGPAVVWMDATGTRLGALHGGAMSTTGSIDGAQFPSVATDAGQTAIAWAARDGIGFTRPRQGSASLAPVMHVAATAKLPRVALGGPEAFIAWEDTRSGAEQVYAVRVSDRDEPSREVLVSREEGSANWPVLAWTGDALAIAYYQFRDGPPEVFLALLGRDLEPIAADLKLSDHAPARFPAIAWTGREIGVAYAEGDRGILLSRATCR